MFGVYPITKKIKEKFSLWGEKKLHSNTRDSYNWFFHGICLVFHCGGRRLRDLNKISNTVIPAPLHLLSDTRVRSGQSSVI